MDEKILTVFETQEVGQPKQIIFPDAVLPPVKPLPTNDLLEMLRKFGIPESFLIERDYDKLSDFFSEIKFGDPDELSENERLFYRSLQRIFTKQDFYIKRMEQNEQKYYPSQTKEQILEARKRRNLNVASYLATHIGEIGQLAEHGSDGLFFNAKLYERMMTGEISVTKNDLDFFIAGEWCAGEFSETGLARLSVLCPEAEATVVEKTPREVIEKSDFLSEEARKFLLFGKDFIKPSSGKGREYVTFLFKNKDKWGGFFDDQMRPTIILIDTMAQQGFLQEEHLTDFQNKLKEKIDIKAFPPAEQKVWGRIMTLSGPVFDFAIKNRHLIAENGLPTPAFFEAAAQNYKGRDLGYLGLLSTDVVAAFPEEENKHFWHFLNTLNDANKRRLADAFIKLGKNSIRTDDDKQFFELLINGKFESILTEGDSEMGAHLITLLTGNADANIDDISLRIKEELIQTIMADAISAELRERLSPTGVNTNDILTKIQSGIDDENWQYLLYAYIFNTHGNLWRLPEDVRNSLINLFKEPSVRDFCQQKIKHSWISYLSANKRDRLPYSFMLLCDTLSAGAGPLTQIESLGVFIRVYRNILLRNTTEDITKQGVFVGLRRIEERFIKEKWSNEDSVNFYNTSTDIMNIGPSLYADFLELFQALNSRELKMFAKELYPLYKARIALIGKSAENLLDVRKELRSFNKRDFAGEKSKLIESIKKLFRARMGIIKTPHELTQEHMRTIINFCLYFGNLSKSTPNKEAALSFFLALTINDKWSAFRRGEEIDPGVYLEPAKSEIVQEILQKRKNLNVLTGEKLVMSTEDLDRLQRLLQDEEQNVLVGDLETIDVRLNNIIRNLEGLTDPDLYPQQIDKQMLRLVLDRGNRLVGAAVAKLYQELAGKAISYSGEEKKVKDEILRILGDNDLETTPRTVNEYFQKKIRPLAVVANLLGAVKEYQADEKIAHLRKILEPSAQVVEIFNRLGESFTSQSGALALSEDLNYLENLINKRRDELKPEEREVLTAYVNSIRNQMLELQLIFDQLKTKIETINSGQSGENPLLAAKIDEITKILSHGGQQLVMTAIMTNDINIIIENIRECLSCLTDRGNNDTNLTFGDGNKFYLVSFAEGQRESVADELAFLIPISYQDKSGLAFVLDNIYGRRTPDVLKSHLAVVLKKYTNIKKQFPRLKLSIVVSQAALSSSGCTTEYLTQFLKQSYPRLNITQEAIEADVPESAFADHYIEFGGEVRTAGKRNMGGLIISD